VPMKRSIAVGVFVIGGFLLFALGLFWIGDRRLLFSENIELETQFSNLSGLKAGSKAMVSGMDAGEVLSIEVPARPSEKFRVRFRVLDHFRQILRADSVASIQVEGLVGSKVLQLDAGTDQAAPVQAGDTVPSREPLEIGAVIQQSVELLKKLDGAVDEVKVEVVEAVGTINELGNDARTVVNMIGGETEEILKSGRAIAKNLDTVVDGVRTGRGLVGKLFNDEKLYDQARNTVAQVEATATNARRTSESVQKMVADIESRKLGETLQKTATNVQQATEQVKGILSTLKPPAGEERVGLIDEMRDTLHNAREATADLAENMEALKRSFFFKGFFNRRGFFDLDAISVQDYEAGKLAPKLDRKSVYIEGGVLFARNAEGEEVLTANGRKQLDEAMVPFLKQAASTLLVVEGYALQGGESEQYLTARSRAQGVREYLIDRFGLKPNYTGAIPLGKGVDPLAAPGTPFEGIALVLFSEKAK